MFKTNEELVEKQKQYWDEDFAMPGDSFSELGEIAISDLVFEDELLKIYDEKEEDKKIIKNLADAIKAGTPLPPVLINEKQGLVDGYHRVLAAKSLGLTHVPFIKVIQVPR